MRAVLLISILALAACAKTEPSDVQATKVWAQPIDKTGTSVAVYMTISDKCSTPDELRSVDARAPQKASLHKSSVVDNALRMEPVSSVVIGCKDSTMLKPMGTHVMVMNLAAPVTIGTQIPLSLNFARSAPVDVVAEVTSMAILEDVDPMHMNMRSGSKGMGGMRMR